MSTPTPPPPAYAPTAGLVTTWWTPGQQPTPDAKPGEWWKGWKPAPTVDKPEPEDEAEQPVTDGDATGFDLQAFADRLGQLVTETPQERAERQRAEREASFKASGETSKDRKARHKAERKEHQRLADRKARQAKQRTSGRARRFRRWCILTALSASAGYAVGLVQILADGGTGVALFAAGLGWALDLRIRGWGQTRVSEVRHPLGLAVMVVARAPLASGLAAALAIIPTTH